MSANKNRKRKRVNNCNITQVIKTVVAAELGVKVTDVNNHTDLDYFAAMNTTFDLQHRYPDISFPEPVQIPVEHEHPGQAQRADAADGIGNEGDDRQQQDIDEHDYSLSPF